jgi:thermitase
VAGAAAAIGNNAEGVAGVAFTNWVMPVKVLDSAGNGSHSAIANGITYAADNGARVINLSLGSASSSRTLQSAVNYAWNKNAVIVAAAGNSGDTTLHYPAAYSNVIGVSALDGNDRLPSWATHGSHVALSAPGVSILSTTRGGGYGASSGSSFASPLVAGAAGLVLAVAPTLSNVAVVDILQTTADDLGAAGYDTLYGHGRVNASAAVQKAAGSAPKDTTAPTVTIVSPREGATVAGTVGVEIDAHDNVGVSRVELYLNGTLFASSTHAVTTLAWDTTKSADGDYRLEARAYDAAGNVGTSAAVRLKVANTPPPAPAILLSVAIVSPADGSTVSKNVKIDVAAQGGSGTINRIELYINGTLHGTATASPASFTWNTNRIPSGSYRLQAFARDSSGAIAESAVITVRR